MRTLALVPVVLALGLVPAARVAQAGDAAAPSIAWAGNLAQAFASATKEDKPVFVAIGATRVEGSDRVEPAGKELRDHTYHDAAVVAKSRRFVCVYQTADATGEDMALLREHFGVEGAVVSPQHLFAYPDGTRIDRHEYWPYRAGKPSVDALLRMMEDALTADTLRRGDAAAGAEPAGKAPPAGTADPSKPSEPAKPPEAPKPSDAPPPADPGAAAPPDAARADWIRGEIEKVRKGSAARDARDVAIKDLMAGDRKGDCVEPLCVAMLDFKKDPESQVAILKAVGKPGLLIAAPPTWSLLDDHEDDVRANAAVTLEYIGDPRAVEPLSKRIAKERDDDVHDDLCRALGRCGAKQEAVRKTLLHEFATSKTEKASAGPIIGLAYFEKDAEAARAVEKLAQKEGDRFKRSALLWCLAEIGDPKSADFVSKEIVAHETNQLALAYNNAVVSVLKGDEEGRTVIDRGMEWVMRGAGVGQGSARRGRDKTEWKPKGEFGGGGGFGGGPRGPGGGTPGMGG